jgi:hypothetical protein
MHDAAMILRVVLVEILTRFMVWFITLCTFHVFTSNAQNTIVKAKCPSHI